ncbi:MAG: ATP-binding protein [Candidatus Saccharibacteria bacterium]
MYSKEQDNIDYYKEDANWSVRFTGMVAPILAALYGLFVRFNILNIDHAPINASWGNWDLYIITSLLLIFGIVQWALPGEASRSKIVQVFIYQVLFGLFVIFISGIALPFIIFWLFFVAGPYTYRYGKIFLPSVGIFGAIVLSYIFINNADIQTISYGISLIIIVPYIGWTIVRTQVTNFVDKTEISTSEVNESMERDQFLTIINNLSDAVISTDMDGTIRVYNAASLNLLDTNSSLIGKNISEILPVTNRYHEPVNIFREIKKSKAIVRRDDLTHTFSDGEEMRLEMTFSPIRGDFGNVKVDKIHDGYIIIARDITKAKSLEEERDEFISVISHELRTPITIAEGTVSNLQMMIGHPKSTAKILKDSIGLAHKQVLSLADIVNDLSDLSRAERGVGDAAEVINVADLAHQMINRYAKNAKEKDLQLDLDLAPQTGNVFVSRPYLEELLQNLIANAIKYTKEGSVKITIDKKDDKIKFAIRDTGIGIGKSDIDKVFDKFYRSEDYRTRETGGTGLGLYISAKLAEKLDTKINLTSRLNVGSTFSFTLPEFKEKID